MKKLLCVAGILILLIVIGLFGAGLYFYNVAIVPGQKSFISENTTLKRSDPLYSEKKWFQDVPKKIWFETSATGNLRLDADYIKAAKPTTKTAIIAHGYMGSKEQMGQYAALFHDLGYNVLLPDSRGQGASQGKVIGYGWLDRLDYIKWAKQVVQKNGQNSQIVLFGISMGASGMTMASGESSLPSQVKAFVVDSPFTTADAEISHQATTLYHLPRFPLVPITSAITKVRAGYSFKEADALAQVKKNKTPIMFISGSADTFVPHAMTKTLYQATKAPKKMLTVKGAKHVGSFSKEPERYRNSIQTFLAHYIH
ncbi:alpha/beta hydrolase [Loigolactobacillus backii]|uniref:Alpha/beta hydrolase n=1 Tax=Loigolactobacillus backii TaxID=375175 RepID=A0A192GZZ8_9LACO|nr:alpha/beta hydrolase [Loigolactobacillus backii]ANK60823.1 alpha/beta hydrolase [Loigolactobacillus backii]ANK61603.1 alpha/beta hydrolase [Loigolactobacillus backii]ANK68253.1 alpha/beta hydrolase [Loigolactobacillus backii]ANK69197.1 alpha/beta hydrolase [Loigolactobacillus backii]MDA5388076.1 alpha/beta hydrolase [Loigolactobacillus backii]